MPFKASISFYLSGKFTFMTISKYALLLSLSLLGACAARQQPPAAVPATDENSFLSNTRQVTFVGARAGEGYFSADGTKIIFQAEREDKNPFYQIYILERQTGAVNRVSPGHGKTTCSWFHPDGNKVLFASSHKDPLAHRKADHEFELRKKGEKRRYQWDFDETMDIFSATTAGKNLVNLTNSLGYDAEGSFSPDGTKIVFASNRAGYAKDATPENRELVTKDPSALVDLYSMNADGTEVRQLTTSPGYDGGPFFSADGQYLTWRRFSLDGQSAEIFTMRIDGTEEHQLTKNGVLSWAPYFHPSGDYLIYANNSQGHANFELFVVDRAGTHEPVRITTTDGFDGLPVFSPDGKELLWTSNRTAGKTSQLFLADWNDGAIRGMLGLSPR